MKFFILLGIVLAAFSQTSQAQESKAFNFKSNTIEYKVSFNDTLARIALKNNVSVAFLLYLNKSIKNPDRIYEGDIIKVPNKDAQEYILQESKKHKGLIAKMGAMTYKERHQAIKEMIQKDWIVIPLLRKALDHEDVEIRENAREALREIHRQRDRAQIQ